MQLLGDLLPDRAGSLLSLNSLREDLEVSHRAASNWMNILESFYDFTIALEFIPMQLKIFDHLKRRVSFIYGMGRKSIRNRQDLKIA
jgi:hypothetical protein